MVIRFSDTVNVSQYQLLPQTEWHSPFESHVAAFLEN